MTTPTIQLVRRRRRRRARATVSPCPLEIRSNNVSASGSSPSFMNSSRLPRPWRRSNGSLIARRPPCRTPLAAVAALETDVRPPCQRTHRALRRGPGRSVRSTSTTTGLHDLIPTATPTRRPAPHESRSERPTGGDHATNETASTRSRLCADHVAGQILHRSAQSCERLRSANLVSTPRVRARSVSRPFRRRATSPRHGRPLGSVHRRSARLPCSGFDTWSRTSSDAPSPRSQVPLRASPPPCPLCAADYTRVRKPR